MSSLIDPRSVNKETPDQGVRDDRERSPVIANVGDDVSEEGEIEDDLPRSVNEEMPDQGVRSEEGEIEDDLPIRTKRQRSPSIDEEPVSKKLKPAPEPMPRPFNIMMRPYEATSCVISVNQKELIGRLFPEAQALAVMLFVNPGPEYAPAISLSLKIAGETHARIEWDTEAICKRQFAISNFEYHHCDLNATNPRLSDRQVLDQCPDSKLGELFYMRFDSWPQAAGFSVKAAFKKQRPSVKQAIDTMSQPRESYSVEIWFIAPFRSNDFRWKCLRYFDHSLRRRRNTLHEWQDRDGVRYIDTPIPPTNTRPNKKTDPKMMFRLPKVPQAHDAGTTVDAMSIRKVQAAGPSTSQHPEKQTMLTSEAGPSSLPASEPVRAFLMPEGKSRRKPPPVKGFMPAMFGGSDDSEQDAGGEEDEEEQHGDEEEEEQHGDEEEEEEQYGDEEEGNDSTR